MVKFPSVDLAKKEYFESRFCTSATSGKTPAENFQEFPST